MLFFHKGGRVQPNCRVSSRTWRALVRSAPLRNSLKCPCVEATLFLDKRARYPYFSVCQLDDLEAQLSKRNLPMAE
jgi:hypothetical protein